MALRAKSSWVWMIALGIFTAFTASSTSEAEALRRAPQFALQDLDRRVHRLADFDGRVVVVNFWASWCVPCRQELPSMNRASRLLPDTKFTWLAVNVGEDREAVKAFLRDYPIDFTVLLDPDGEVSRDWWVTGMPTTVVVNPVGEMVHRIVGKQDWDDVQHLQLLRRLIDHDG